MLVYSSRLMAGII